MDDNNFQPTFSFELFLDHLFDVELANPTRYDQEISILLRDDFDR